MYKLPVIRLINSGDVVYSMMTVVNNAVLYVWKLLRQQILKVLITHKKMLLCEVMDLSKYGNHFATYAYIKSLYCPS